MKFSINTINKSSNFLPHREQMQNLRIYSNYESKSSFFSYNLSNLLLCITFQPALPSTDHWSHLGPSESQGALGTPSIQDIIICHFPPVKNPEPPCLHSPHPHHQDSSSSFVSSTFMVSLKSFDPDHSHSRGEGSSPPHSPLRSFQQLLSISMAPRLPLPAATHSPCWCYQFKNMNLILLILCLKPYRSSLLHEQD